MKENVFLDGISNIDSDVVERFISMDNKLQMKVKTKSILLRVGTIAACFALIVSAAIAILLMRGGDSGISDVPIWDNAKYSAHDVAKLFSPTNDELGINDYTRVFVSDSKYLYIDPISEEEHLFLYQYHASKLNKSEFKKFIDAVLPPLATSIDHSVPQYEIIIGDKYKESLSVNIDLDSYLILMSQTEAKSFIQLGKYSSSGDRRIFLDGESVRIDQRMSDEEIINSIQPLKNKLFAIFGESFSSTKIVRKFDGFSKNGATFVTIYFYDGTHPLNSLSDTPTSNYISITFDNLLNFPGDIVSDDILSVATIRFTKSRKDINSEYASFAKAKRISLEDAEKLLYNGYVFGGHSCPQCMAVQEKVSFEGYDFVDMEYVIGRDYQTGEPTTALPFYAFYKKIGTATNGNDIYAKTYVCAIEVSGYKEYFESQTSNHKNSFTAVE